VPRLRTVAAGLLLLSFVTHTVQFLWLGPSPTNTNSAAGFGVAYLVIGLLLLRPAAFAVWLGAIVLGIGSVLSSLVALGNPDGLAIFHAVLNWVVFACCVALLLRGRAPSSG